MVKNNTKIYFSIQLNIDGCKYYGVDNVRPEVIVSFLPRPDITFAVAIKQLNLDKRHLNQRTYRPIIYIYIYISI